MKNISVASTFHYFFVPRTVDPTLPYNKFKNEVLRLPNSVFGDLIEL